MRSRRRVRVVVIVLASFVAVMMMLVAIDVTIGFVLRARGQRQTPDASLPSPAVNARPLVLTYFYYWYDAQTGQHLTNAPLPVHPAMDPAPSWHNVLWYRKQLGDMAYAGIDVVLPVYWGFNGERWSEGGLPYLVEAREAIVASGMQAPAIGMFFDTTILNHLDLTQQRNIAYFYANVKDFFQRIPRADWALVDKRPIVWIFLPQNNSFDQSVFDHTYEHFNQDFGVYPYIVRATGWDCAMTAVGPFPPKPDCAQLIHTDSSFVWGVAQNGYQPAGGAAAVGPGYDEREIPGRRGVYRPRDGGEWYRKNFELAIASRKRLLAIETWNEFHEASAISESLEYGRTYIELTRELTAEYHTALASG